jgi:polysaccharide deacetylase 2 family uncharacterized protein YibQ
MAVSPEKKLRKKPDGPLVAASIILVLVALVVSGYYFFAPPGKKEIKAQKTELSQSITEKSSTLVQQSKDKKQTVVAPPTPPLPEIKVNSSPSAKIPEIVKRGSTLGTMPRLAIIIDDMGSSLPEARSLAAINVPLTFSIIPGLRVDKEVAAFAATNKIETMIHVPMQSKGWPERRLENNGLLVSMDSGELQERVSGFVQRLPGAVGINNHMGSEFSEHEDKMESVLHILKKNNLFFIDSVTSPKSAGLSVAQRLGVRSARRNVFLDNEQERGYILGQLNQAVRMAKKNGSAIAICHPHAATLAALTVSLPELAGQGVRLVPVSQLVR